MADKDEKEKKGIVSGILNDLAMGVGLKARDQDYYERTARTIGRNEGSGQAAGRYYDRMAAQGFPSYGGPIGFLSGGRGIQGPRDFFDGGGLGQSGDRFRGSPYSLLANALGIKPMGYQQRAIDAAVADASRSVGSMPQAPATPAAPLRIAAGTPTAGYEPAPFTSEQPLSSYLTRFDSTNITMPLTSMSQAAPAFPTAPAAIAMSQASPAAPTAPPTFEDFMANQRSIEDKYGLTSVDDPEYYQRMYQRFLTRTQ